MKKLNKFLFVCLFALVLFGCSKKTNTGTKTNTNTNDDTSQKQEETFTIKFVDSDDTLLEEVKVKKGDTPTFSKANPTKASDAYSYTFNGWDKAITAASSDTTYKATYTQTAIDFDINYELNGGTNNENNPSKYNITMDNITLSDPSKEGYSFTGWLSGSTTITTIDTSSAKNIDVEATWSINSYDVDIVKSMNDAGTFTGSGTYEFNSEVTLTATTNTGYKFVGFYEGTELLSDEANYSFPMPAKALAIVAVWEYDTYTVSVQNDNSNYGSISGDGTYAYKSNVTLTATPNTGYSFKGWYLNDALKSNSATYSFEMPNNDIELVAKWEVNLYEITIVNQITGTTISGAISGSNYAYSEAMTLTISNASDRKWVRWSRNDGVEYVGNEYSFNVPARSLTITVSYLETEYYKNGNTVYFGYYPQSLESDSTIISNLNAKVTKLPTDADNDWISYGYYDERNTTAYMWYIDVDLNNDGFLDYRGVYFTKYRPSDYSASATSGNSHIPGNGFTIENVYWFKYEVIKWNVIATNDNKVTLLADLTLDCQEYFLYESNFEFEHNGGTGTANDYVLSNIRIWLNNQFYNTAFSSAEKAIIKESTVTNSETRTSDGITVDYYDYETTSDNVYLLSWREAAGIGGGDGTAYARIQGARKIGSNTIWMLRSPDQSRSSITIHYGASTAAWSAATLNGVRPAICIEL